MKIEGEGAKQIDGRDTRVPLFESRNALVVGKDRNDVSLGDCDRRLRTQVEKALARKGCEHISRTGGMSIEISKERLLELAENARTRDQMAAEREPFESV